jgi:hypothetical protein
MLMALPGTGGTVFAISSRTITPPSTIQEGADFATSVLRDPWDMSEYTDVSQYINESGQRNLVKNISVSNGVFSGASVGNVSTGNAYFFPLFPGYLGTIQTGKVGSRYPIPKSTNKCLYISMKVDSGPNSDKFRVFWFANEHLNDGQAPWGQSPFIDLYPEAGGSQPVQSWRLYSVNLSTIGAIVGTTWNAMPSVEGLRIDPTISPNNFAVDWVRLTDCNAVNANLNWTGGTSADTAIWLRPVGTTRDIRVATGVTGTSGSYNLDIQGIAPGSYYVGLGTTTTCCSQMNTSQPLVINQAPIVSFDRPSFFSGASQSWGFGSSSNVTGLNNFKSTSFQNGELNMVTASGPQPAGIDAQVVLNTSPISSNAYRYLSFRMFTQEGSAPWQNVVDGGMARFIWAVSGYCWLVGQDIDYDIGYQTYSIDLYNAFNGSAEVTSGFCGGLPTTWQTSGIVYGLRFDPNENISCNPQFAGAFVTSTCGDYVQKLDWIRLTAIDQTTKGTPFPIQITLNRPLAGVTFTFYYTTTLSNPTQSLAQLYTPPTISIGPFQLYLPTIFKNSVDVAGDTFPSVDVTYMWDTTSVSLGTYYICAQANDGYNTTTYCSEAPVIVAP